MKSVQLKGITWDHPRGYQPLHATSAVWKTMSGADLHWNVRTLKEFGDTPVEELALRYDLIIIDHPYMGEAFHNGLLLPLNDYLSPSTIELLTSQSVGPSFNSYRYNGSLLAVPIDAAAQVSAYRPDIIEKIKWTLPANTASLKEAALELPTGHFIGVPLCPTDIWCVFLTLCAQFAGNRFFQPSGIDEDAAAWALNQLHDWKSFLHPDSFGMNPVQMLDHMSVADDIVYIPFLFGYTNYSRKDFTGKHVRFGNVPEFKQGGLTSVLGGAGIAVSKTTKDIDACIDFIRYVSDPAVQKSVYCKNGGQPAQRAAWENETCDADCEGFFSGTRETMDRAYLRPRWPGFNRFQEKAADLIHEAIQKNDNSSVTARELNHLLKSYCGETVR